MRRAPTADGGGAATMSTAVAAAGRRRGGGDGGRAGDHFITMEQVSRSVRQPLPSAAAGRAIETHGTVETSFEGAPARQRK